MTDLLALAERVEALQGPDREVDAAIYVALMGFPERAYQLRNGMRPKGTPDLDRMAFVRDWGVLGYTASIDAAMSLVPEGAVWLRKSPETMSIYTPPVDDKVWATHIDAKGATPSLALTAASLRTRASTTPENPSHQESDRD